MGIDYFHTDKVTNLLLHKGDVMKKITFDELKRLSFCNSEKLQNKLYILGEDVVEWVGIGFIDVNIPPDPEKHITVID